MQGEAMKQAKRATKSQQRAINARFLESLFVMQVREAALMTMRGDKPQRAATTLGNRLARLLQSENATLVNC